MQPEQHKILMRINGVRRAWQHAFLNESGSLNENGVRALGDLANFCYANRSCIKMSPKSGMIDPMASIVAEARREVWLRIMQALDIDDQEIQRLINQTRE